MLFIPSRRSFTLVMACLAGLLAGCSTAPAPTPTPQPPPPAPPAQEEVEYKNTLRWTTASEVDNFGFDVYRGDHEEGPFERRTESPIPGTGTTDLTTDYVWEDHDIDPHRAYYYYVESISMQGVRELFTPVIRAKAKLPADGAAEEEAAELGDGDSP